MTTSIEARIVDIIARAQGVPREEVALDSSFDDLGIDSLEGANIVFEIEDEFDVYIPYEAEELASLTVRDAVAGVARAVDAKDADDSAGDQ